MSNSTTTSVYVKVIEDVVTKIRNEFINNSGPGEDVLNQLQGLWELKMMQAGSILAPPETSSSSIKSNAVRDLNVPYEEYETPTADLLFPPTPLQTPMSGQTPLPYNIPTINYFSPLNQNGGLGNRVGRPSQYMQPPVSWLNQRPALNVNVAYVDGRAEVERGSASQPTTQDLFQLSSGKRKREDFTSQYRPDGVIPQQDGAGDIYNFQGVVSEDYNVANTPAPPELHAQTPVMANQNDVLDDDEDEPLYENDDDEDLDDVDQEEELNTNHLVLTQFDKVTRSKSKWKCTLKDGVMHINNKDVLFNKASGEFDF